MTTFEQKVKEIAKEIHDGTGDWHQIVIDLVQDEVDELFDQRESLRSEEPESVSYHVHNLREVFAPMFSKEIDFLIRLENALDDWAEDMRENNKLLGISPEL